VRDFLTEYWQFIQENRAYWLVPFILILLLAGGLMIFAKGSAIAPFIYTLF
jgi:hypothetical protein